MSILQTTPRIDRRSPPGPRHFEIPESLLVSVITLAQYERRPVAEILLDILAAGLTQYSTKERVWKQWESLTEREKEAAALVCLGCSNGQIATRMTITPAGVKFHLRNAYAKCRVKNRAMLRKKFRGWDFKSYAKFTPGTAHVVRRPGKSNFPY